MFTKNTTGVSATRELIVPRALSLLSDWYETGIRNSPHITYHTILQAIVPGHGGGQAQNRFIGEACRMFENIYQTEISTLAPNLPENQNNGEWHTDMK